MIMRNICLKFYGLGIEDKFQAYIQILSNENKNIYEGFTYNGDLSICLNTNCVYKLILSSCFFNICTCFYVDSVRNCYYFSFFEKEKIVTFQLTDFHYENLKIGKGEMILWQRL